MSNCNVKQKLKDFTSKKRNRIILIVVAVVLLLAIVAGILLGVFMNKVYKTSDFGNVNTKVWYSYMDYKYAYIEYDGVYEQKYPTEYNAATMNWGYDYIVEIEKNPDKDFVILNLADVQIYGIEYFWGKDKIMRETVRRLIDEVKPDLITLTGDNVWGSDAVCSNEYFIEMMESFKIPWAPVFGNHDGEWNDRTYFNYLADTYLNCEYCLFKKGPYNIGPVGNYIINVKENGNIIHTLFMLNSGNGSGRTTEYANFTNGGEGLTELQVQWYKWAVEGIAEQEGHTVSSTIMFHIPLPEFKIAYDEVGPYAGSNDETSCTMTLNSGLFEVAKELGSTKQIICGHDHVNDSMVHYQGIDLIYALKTGDGCYWDESGNKNGGTVITIGANGATVNTQHHYIKLGE